MKILKTSEGKRTVLYSFETQQEYYDSRYLIMLKGNDGILFSGTKTELLSKSEEFWKGVVEKGSLVKNAFLRCAETKIPRYRDYTVTGFASLKGSKRLPFKTAKESGVSLLENEKEFIIIVEEKP